MTAADRAPAGRRAPRLGPDDRIAPHLTRVGRFRRIDPTKGRPLPGLVRLVGVVGWAVLLAESFRRAFDSARR